MRKVNWIVISSILMITALVINSCGNSAETDYPDGYAFKVEHIVQGYLGENHLTNLVYRKGIEGDRFVGWGRYPVTEWPIGSASRRQVVPAGQDRRYSNGGCSMDITGDGIDEIITARGEMANLANATLLWFQEVEGEEYWEEYKIASIWPGGYISPHDIVPYIKQTASGEEFRLCLQIISPLPRSYYHPQKSGRFGRHSFLLPQLHLQRLHKISPEGRLSMPFSEALQHQGPWE